MHWSEILGAPEAREAERASFGGGSTTNPSGRVKNTLTGLGKQYGSYLYDYHQEQMKPWPTESTNALMAQMRNPQPVNNLNMDPAVDYTMDLVTPMLMKGGFAGIIAGKGAKTADNALLEIANNAAEKGLPMDEASRMGRAREFGPEYFHGTGADITQFSPKNLSGKPTSHYLDIGVHGSRSTETPNTYAQYSGFGGNKGLSTGMKRGDPVVYPLRMKADNPLDIRKGFPQKIKSDLVEFAISSGVPEKSKYLKLMDNNPLDLLGVIQRKAGRKELKEFLTSRGYDAVDYKWQGGDHRMVFDPKNIRSRFAAFDPAKKDSANILAGAAGLALAHWSQILGEDDAL